MELWAFILSPYVRESQTVLDSGFHVVDSGSQALDSSLGQLNLDSGFQSLVGFRIQKPRIPDSRIRIPLYGAVINGGPY